VTGRLTPSTKAPTLHVTITVEDVEASRGEGGIRWITALAENGSPVRFWADEETMRQIAGRVSSWGTSTVPIPLGHIEGAV
jgi:hypothetical protein